MENKPKTKKECFALLDEMLSEADKKAIVIGYIGSISKVFEK